MKQNIMVIFGGKSVEHDISVITGVQAINNLNKDKYTIYPVFIDKQGRWFFNEKFDDINNIINYKNLKSTHSVAMLPQDQTLYKTTKNKLKKLATIDCIICCTHGASGENGALQGLFELINVPYTSPNVLSSAICMDKLISKKLFENSLIPVCPYMSFGDNQIQSFPKQTVDQILSKLDLPLVIKPNNLGSSIGISFVKDKKSLKQALILASSFSDKVIVEKAVTNLYEINVSVFYYNNKVQVSLPEKPTTNKDFLSFEEKYLHNPSKKSGMASLSREFPAKISKDIYDKIISYSTQAYLACNLNGLVRVDYLVDSKTNNVYINEINTIPGSLSFYLWKDKYSFMQLLDIMIEESIKNKAKLNKKTIVYDTNVLDNFALNSDNIKMHK